MVCPMKPYFIHAIADSTTNMAKKVFCKTSDDEIPCSSSNQGILFEPNGCVSWQKRVNRFNSREQEEAQWNTRSNG